MRAWRRRAFHACLGLVALAVFPARAADPVVLLLSEPGGAYAEAANAARRELGAAAEVTVRLVAEGSSPQKFPPKAALALGSEACARLAKNEVSAPVRICALLPKSAFDRLAASARGNGKPPAALVLDQPLARQLALIRLALPERVNLGVVLGPESKSYSAALEEAGRATGLRVQTGEVASADDLADVLRQTLHERDVLLALPDAVVFNSHTIHNVLVTAFRSRVPLIAFSPAYVRAGALLAIYATPEQIGRQAGQVLRAALAGREPAPVQGPQEFTIGVNRDVARSMGIDLESESTLAARLRKWEETR